MKDKLLNAMDRFKEQQHAACASQAERVIGCTRHRP